MSLDIFGQLRSLIKRSTVCIDDSVFTFHYRLSVIILVSFSLIISSRKYFGDPIDCTAHRGDIARIADNFCWFNSYIIVPKDPTDPYKYSGQYHRYRPVINEAVRDFEQLEQPHSLYKAHFLHGYQWIEFILFFQAMLFFIPRYLWRYCWEQGRVKALTQGYAVISLKEEAIDEDEKRKFVDLVKYIKRNKFDHLEYAWKYVICEVLNLINVASQYFILKSRLGLTLRGLIDDFFSSNSLVKPESPINLVFPKLARCEIPTGDGAGHSYSLEMCVLPVNVFVAQMYIFLWFYFAGLSIVSGFSLVYRVATVVSPDIRCLLLKRSSRAATDDYMRTVRKLGYGEWFLLRLVAKNMDHFSFKNLLKEYNTQMAEYRPSLLILGEDLKGAMQMQNIKNDAAEKSEESKSKSR